MSRNFELLQQASKEELLTPGSLALPIDRSASRAISMRDSGSDEIAKLVQRLFFRGGQTAGPRVVSFSGITRDDRSGWICARTAETLAAQTEAAVCVLDANAWAPQLHRHFLVGNCAGLAAALTTEGSIRSFTTLLPGANLWLMTTGAPGPNPCTHTDRYRSRLAELRKEFNYVLISAPPLGREAEATMIGQLADGLVMIVEANKNRRESIRQMKEDLAVAQVQLLGAVLDQRTFPIPEFLYRRL